MAEEKKLGELVGTAAAGANALEAKKDHEHTQKDKIEEEIGAAEAAVGSGGVTFNEHHEKKETIDKDEEARRKMLRNPFR
ncbi:abscisic stress-ripening protein 1-like isoform X2 [Vicia villosa]|uniref:abscisic stress-ripening protein 1-like isoform X2 n=1 Tax=Vicia villosa TaxID=3911 RepID=UPI00273C843D|nr:abscisic stress-ripening protein 1-like isoform X2 [Vicia villosa]